MAVTLYYRENVTALLTALYASIEDNSDYDQGRRAGILLVATALDILPEHVIVRAGLSQPERTQPAQPRLRIINDTRRLTSGR